MSLNDDESGYVPDRMLLQEGVTYIVPIRENWSSKILEDDPYDGPYEPPLFDFTREYLKSDPDDTHYEPPLLDFAR